MDAMLMLTNKIGRNPVKSFFEINLLDQYKIKECNEVRSICFFWEFSPNPHINTEPLGEIQWFGANVTFFISFMFDVSYLLRKI